MSAYIWDRHLAVLLAGLLCSTTAGAHDVWADGSPIPPWIKQQCCGVSEAHHLRPDQVHRVSEGYRVDIYKGVIEARTALPSEDGDYWIFFACDEPTCTVHCFFVPMAF